MPASSRSWAEWTRTWTMSPSRSHGSSLSGSGAAGPSGTSTSVARPDRSTLGLAALELHEQPDVPGKHQEQRRRGDPHPVQRREDADDEGQGQGFQQEHQDLAATATGPGQRAFLPPHERLALARSDDPAPRGLLCLFQQPHIPLELVHARARATTPVSSGEEVRGPDDDQRSDQYPIHPRPLSAVSPVSATTCGLGMDGNTTYR